MPSGWSAVGGQTQPAYVSTGLDPDDSSEGHSVCVLNLTYTSFNANRRSRIRQGHLLDQQYPSLLVMHLFRSAQKQMDLLYAHPAEQLSTQLSLLLVWFLKKE